MREAGDVQKMKINENELWKWGRNIKCWKEMSNYVWEVSLSCMIRPKTPLHNPTNNTTIDSYHHGFCFPLTSSFTLLPAISLLEIPAGNHAFFLLTILLEVLCFWRTVQLVRPCVVVIWLFSLRHTLKICSSIRDDDCICTRKSTLYRQNTLPLF